MFLEACDIAQETQEKSLNPDIHNFISSRISNFVTLLITGIVLVLLMIPIGLLYYLALIFIRKTTDSICVDVLMVSTIIFTTLLLLFAKAKRHEILAAAAA